MKSAAPRATIDKADAPVAGRGVAMVDNRTVAVAQRQALAAIGSSPRQVAQRQQAAAAAPPKNTTGLPDNLKAGVENLSGYSLDDVTVHYNSAKPAQLQAHAYAQGTDIHVAPGQEQHLPHEAWHVVQQKQGRVKPTESIENVLVNSNSHLESEADTMGKYAKKLSADDKPQHAVNETQSTSALVSNATPIIGTQAIQQAHSVQGTEVAQLNGAGGHRKSIKQGIDPEEFRHKRQEKTQESRRDKRGVALASRRAQPGTHGFKKTEQQNLKAEHGFKVTGETHESEHSVGFEPINRTSGLKRGTAGRARMLENTAPAYQEVKEMHRAHIGTGTHNTADSSVFNSEQYREAQRSLVKSGDVSSAVQLNQLAYAFDKGFNANSATTEGKAATSSFGTMVRNMQNFTYAEGDQNVTVPVNARQRAEMHLARLSAITGNWPTAEQIKETEIQFGLDNADEK